MFNSYGLYAKHNKQTKEQYENQLLWNKVAEYARNKKDPTQLFRDEQKFFYSIYDKTWDKDAALGTPVFQASLLTMESIVFEAIQKENYYPALYWMGFLSTLINRTSKYSDQKPQLVELYDKVKSRYVERYPEYQATIGHNL